MVRAEFRLEGIMMWKCCRCRFTSEVWGADDDPHGSSRAAQHEMDMVLNSEFGHSVRITADAAKVMTIGLRYGDVDPPVLNPERWG